LLAEVFIQFSLLFLVLLFRLLHPILRLALLELVIEAAARTQIGGEALSATQELLHLV